MSSQRRSKNKQKQETTNLEKNHASDECDSSTTCSIRVLKEMVSHILAGENLEAITKVPLPRN